MIKNQRITIICPVYNEEVTVPIFYNRFKSVIEKLKYSYGNNYSFDILFIDNCSVDSTLKVIQQLAENDNNVYYLGLSKNFGYQKSIECGIKNARGDGFIIIDVDCEDPPEMIESFLKKYEEGYQIVYGKRVDREEIWFLKLFRKIFYLLTRSVSDENFNLFMAEFCFMTSEVRDAIIQDNNSFPFIRASIGRIGYESYGIDYKRDKRIAGESHYNLYRMTTFAIAGILSSSTFLLRIPAYSFPFWAILIILLYTLQLLNGFEWIMPTMQLLSFLYIGYTVMSISIYEARIYKNGLQRPNVLINKRKTKMQL
jgi:polyisoprenyl-phosphate glycosyltransferase